MRDNTLIVFSSDNGGPHPGRVTDNGPLRAGKGTLYEGGVRVAACATWHGQDHSRLGRQRSRCTWSIGIRRCCKLAGASLEQKLPLDGRDAVGDDRRGKPSPHSEILLNATPNNGAIRVGDWKLVLNGTVPADEGPQGQEAKPDRQRRRIIQSGE